MVGNGNGGDWNIWSKYVILELKRLNECNEHLSEKIAEMREDIIILQVKSGIWGAVAGAVTVITVLLFKKFGG